MEEISEGVERLRKQYGINSEYVFNPVNTALNTFHYESCPRVAVVGVEEKVLW